MAHKNPPYVCVSYFPMWFSTCVPPQWMPFSLCCYTPLTLHMSTMSVVDPHTDPSISTDTTMQHTVSLRMQRDTTSTAAICVMRMARTKQNYTDDERTTECVICMERPRVTAMVPCGHVSTCTKCTAGLHDCPICRAPVDSTLRVYM